MLNIIRAMQRDLADREKAREGRGSGFDARQRRQARKEEERGATQHGGS
jgi:hypothetical protein